ncbi:hypothetical protein BDW62DRAFT_216154 [Aspergillus aurantiobrunneus]
MSFYILVSLLGMALSLRLPGDRFVVPGWHLQSTSRAAGAPAVWSLPGANVSSWHRIDGRATVIAGLIQSRSYNASDLFYSDRLSHMLESAFQVPWLYREEFDLGPLLPGQHLFLNLHGISSKADVWLNGVHVVPSKDQKGAYAGRSYDITSSTRHGPNALLVVAHPTSYREDLAVGWADWNPYPPDSGMGVWRAVDLHLAGPVSLSSPTVTTSFTASESEGRLAVDVTVETDVTNPGNTPQDVTVSGTIQLPDSPERVQLLQHAHLPPRSTLTVQIWWPAAWGRQPLYQVSLNVFQASGALSDLTSPTNFGIRSVVSALNAHGDIQFKVNGHPFQVRGAGYAPDLFLRFDIQRVEMIFRYALDMGLNTIRLEGKQEHPEFYDLADRMGLMIMAGWECCSKWEAWSYNEESPGVAWRPEDYIVARASMLHEARMMQPHPCMLAFLVGSDYWPDELATNHYLDALRAMRWPNPVVASASNRGHPSQLGPSGMKMEGPYDWVPPNYWYGHELGAAFGFGSELGAGVGTPELSSLRRFLSPAECDSLWTYPNTGQYHLSPAGSDFHNRTIFNEALEHRYGRPTSLEDYVFKAQIMDYEAARAEFEAFAARQNAARPATGVIYWMLNSAWPSLHWQLFDYYLRPGGAYFGAKVGARQEHVVLDYQSSTVHIVNHSLHASGLRRIILDLVGVDGKTLDHRNHTIETRPTTSMQAFSIPQIAQLQEVAFLRLVLFDESNNALSRNVYWVTAHHDVLDWGASNWYTTPVKSYADFTALSRMRAATVEASAVAVTTTQVEVRLQNQGTPAFFLRFTVQDLDGTDQTPTGISGILRSASQDLAPYEDLYRHFHAHPELSLQEESTSQKIAAHLAQLNAYDIHTHIGGFGLAGVLRNGPGKTVLLRADMDALPVKELTGLPYASTVTMRDADGVETPVMHACGHDMHITCLLAAAEKLARIRDAWSGTLIVLFQPNEERGAGAQAMVDDGLYDKIPVPDYALGQHVMRLRAGTIGSRVGTIMAAADSMKITVWGRGGHGSLPHTTIDPVVLAAHIVVRLQSIVSREVDPSDLGVLTVGSLHAGATENIIADRAEIGIDLRSVQLETREKIIAAVQRIVTAECMASGSPKPPVFTPTRRFPPTVNDDEVAGALAASFREHFGDSFDADTLRSNVSEDFSTLATCRGVPCCFWFLGGIDAQLWDEAQAKGTTGEIATNHSALFAPVVQPTMSAGVDALCVGALTFLK